MCDTALSGMCGSDTKQIFLDGAARQPADRAHLVPARARARGGGPPRGHRPAGRAQPVAVVRPTRHQSAVPRVRRRPLPVVPQLRSRRAAGVAPPRQLRDCAAARTPSGSPRTRASCSTSPTRCRRHRGARRPGQRLAAHDPPQTPPDPIAPALVYGCGTLGLAAIGLLRHLYPDVEVWVVSRPGPAAELAAHGRARGADVTTRRPRGRGRAAGAACGPGPVEQARLAAGRPRRRLRHGRQPETIETSMRLLRHRRDARHQRRRATQAVRVDAAVLQGAARHRRRTRSASRRSAAYASTPSSTTSTSCGDGLDLTPIITHRFPFDEWKRAVLTIARRKRTGAVKVLLEQ